MKKMIVAVAMSALFVCFAVSAEETECMQIFTLSEKVQGVLGAGDAASTSALPVVGKIMKDFARACGEDHEHIREITAADAGHQDERPCRRSNMPTWEPPEGYQSPMPTWEPPEGWSSPMPEFWSDWCED